jgi:3-deoxy-7-phosphoheptulonate synthase
MSFMFKRTWGPDPKYPLVLTHQQEEKFYLLAGPCSVESKEQINAIAEHVAKTGATHLRGGIFRAGTYPGKNFGYIQHDLVEAYYCAAKQNGLVNVVEVLDMSPDAINRIDPYADCFQVGCRQMQNYNLLRFVGSSGKPVFLKRHPGSTMDEFLGAAEHVLTAGCKELILIERGSSTHLNHVRWDLSISIIPTIKGITKLPVIVDGSHGTGRRDLVAPMTLAGIAAGADGCLIETHMNPDLSISDADQAISLEDFKKLSDSIKRVRFAL